MPEEIKPALTPEEWLDWRTWFSAHLPTEHTCHENHRSMARSNDALPDGHPAKITWADVAVLREVASQLPTFGAGPNGENIPDPELTTLAAKLGALLPPEAP